MHLKIPASCTQKWVENHEKSWNISWKLDDDKPLLEMGFGLPVGFGEAPRLNQSLHLIIHMDIDLL